MLSRLAFLLLFLTFTTEMTAAESMAQIVATADPVPVSVTPPEDGRKLLRLPGLEFQLTIDARCGKDQRPVSLSVSIADTRRTLLGEHLADATDIVVDLSVPASQLAPIPVDDFCSVEDPEARELLVRDALIAHFSLRCLSEEGESITYATRPLAVALMCNSADQGEGDSEALMLR